MLRRASDDARGTAGDARPHGHGLGQAALLSLLLLVVVVVVLLLSLL